ncbi:MAG: high-affinity nickel-transport protein [Gordonia sp. (in: high G+C Gram-positive bacteria)]
MEQLAHSTHPTAVTDSGRLWAVVVIAGLHLLGWGMLLGLVVPMDVRYGAAGPAAIAVGLAAYALGVRHAFDADHIAAIDNTTRRFVDRGRPASTVGLWFSLGHSSVVFLLCLALVVGFGALGQAIADDSSGVHAVAGVWGPVVSSLFLLAIAGLNFASLRGGHTAGGPVWRVMSRFEQVVDRPTRMYAVGFTFGLGFDTATEIGLLALAGSASFGAVPWWAVLTLPILFAAGMSLIDTVQGAVMRRAYLWSPGRSKALGYGAIMTGISAIVAVSIATVQLSTVAHDTLGWAGPFAWIGSANLGAVGFWLTGTLLAVWASVFVLTRKRVGVGREVPATEP